LRRFTRWSARRPLAETVLDAPAEESEDLLVGEVRYRDLRSSRGGPGQARFRLPHPAMYREHAAGSLARPPGAARRLLAGCRRFRRSLCGSCGSSRSALCRRAAVGTVGRFGAGSSCGVGNQTAVATVGASQSVLNHYEPREGSPLLSRTCCPNWNSENVCATASRGVRPVAPRRHARPPPPHLCGTPDAIDDLRGQLALRPLAIACRAHDRGITVIARSDYIPLWIIRTGPH
jgi:hypothetical protein